MVNIVIYKYYAIYKCRDINFSQTLLHASVKSQFDAISYLKLQFPFVQIN